MTTRTQMETTNGLKVNVQRQIRKAVEQNPQRGQVTFRARNRWVGGTHNTSSLSSYSMGGADLSRKTEFQLEADMPAPFLGNDRGLTPAEYGLLALAACMNNTMVYNCAARGIEVRSSNAYIEGDLDARGFLRIEGAPRAGYKAVRVRFEVDADAPAEAIRDLLSGSPMFDVFTNAVPVEVGLDTPADDR